MAAEATRRFKSGVRFLDPEVLARIDGLDLLARTVVEGFINGLHRSPYLGFSMDFAEHREYMPGDDIRRIDWKVFARSDRFYVKEFEAESNANFISVIDVSRSMNFGSNGVTKFDYARYLAACLTYFASKQRDRVGFASFDNDIVDYVPPSAKHLDTILHIIDTLEPGGRSEYLKPLLKLTEAAKRRGIVVLISDFYEEPRAVIDAVNNLRYRGHDVIVYQVLDRAEIEFDFDEPATYEDLETGESVPVVPARMREQYKQMMAEHLEEISSLMIKSQIDYGLVRTDEPLDESLFRYLLMREKMGRVR
ncbi:MAG: DUF58 domain-containing protein [Acidobacteria bacterium]|nr:DUF58 domain-containing protein [Acidobacteriota bacterium]